MAQLQDTNTEEKFDGVIRLDMESDNIQPNFQDVESMHFDEDGIDDILSDTDEY